MEKFNLDTWLKDKSRKVIDDNGFPVEIIKWDANEKCPVVYLNHNGIAYNVSADGMYDADPNHGLFFADKEDEKIRQALLQCCDDWGKGQSGIMKLEDVQRIRAWLEKQKVNPFSGTFFKYNGDVWGMCARDNGIDVLLNGILFSHLDKTKNQEWSEEDEYCRNQLVVFCENCMQQNSEAIKCANWLKSLKPNHWKPSEDEIRTLQEACSNIRNGIRPYCSELVVLEQLLNELKTLRDYE